MPQYVLVNRRSGLFTDQAKVASRASVQTALSMLPSATIVSDHRPEDPTARHVMLIDADAAHVAAIRARLPHDSILEPAVRRNLHRPVPVELGAIVPFVLPTKTKSASYVVTITAGGKPLAGIDVMLYLRAPGGDVQNTTVKSDAKGKVSFDVPTGFEIAFVEPIPYSGSWIMFAGAPPSGSSVECLPIAKADANSGGWWHQAMNIDLTDKGRGAGI